MHIRLSRALNRLGCFGLFWLGLFPGTARPEALNLQQLAAGLYVHQGHQVAMAASEHDDIANIGFILGDECVAVIDSGGSVRIGAQLHRALRRITGKPICYVINTHVHYDHVLGNAAFLREQAKFVGHRNLSAAIDNNREFFLKNFIRELGNIKDPARIKGPDLRVDKSLVLDLGKRKIRLIAHQTAHTDSDLSILDLKTNTLWASDLLFVKRIPVINGSLKGWIAESGKLASSDYSLIIPGHGPVPKSPRAAIAAQIRYLETLRDEILAILGQGGFLEDALEKVGLAERSNWLLFDENHKRNVTRAFAELEWE